MCICLFAYVYLSHRLFSPITRDDLPPLHYFFVNPSICILARAGNTLHMECISIVYAIYYSFTVWVSLIQIPCIKIHSNVHCTRNWQHTSNCDHISQFVCRLWKLTPSGKCVNKWLVKLRCKQTIGSLCVSEKCLCGHGALDCIWLWCVLEYQVISSDLFSCSCHGDWNSEFPNVGVLGPILLVPACFSAMNQLNS